MKNLIKSTHGGARKCAGRPKSDETVTISLRVKVTDLIKWRELCNGNLNKWIVNTCNKV